MENYTAVDALNDACEFAKTASVQGLTKEAFDAAEAWKKGIEFAKAQAARAGGYVKGKANAAGAAVNNAMTGVGAGAEGLLRKPGYGPLNTAADFVGKHQMGVGYGLAGAGAAAAAGAGALAYNKLAADMTLPLEQKKPAPEAGSQGVSGMTDNSTMNPLSAGAQVYAERSDAEALARAKEQAALILNKQASIIRQAYYL